MYECRRKIVHNDPAARRPIMVMNQMTWHNLLLMTIFLISLNLTLTSTFTIFTVPTLGMSISGLKKANVFILQPYPSAVILT